MKITRDLLQTFFDKPLPSAVELAERISLHSFETELEDGVLDIDVTPNRGSDCSCVYGIACEVSAIFNIPLKRTFMDYSTSLKETDNVEVNINDSRCNRYSVTLIEGIDNTIPTPKWIVDSLAVFGGHSINLVVDVVNYVMFEFGIPMHAFDTTKIPNNSISVDRLEGEAEFVTLSNEKVMLPKGTMVIKSDEVLAIAGIKGGLDSGTQTSTKSILLEAAHFDASCIRKTSRDLKLKTDASYRYEHNVSSEMIPCGINRVVDILQSISKDVVVKGYKDLCPKKASKVDVNIPYALLNDVFGEKIERGKVESILRSLYMEILSSTHEGMTVRQPINRTDILIKEDVVEEVVRMIGYNSLPRKDVSYSSPKQNVSFSGRNKLIEIAVSCGFSEVMTRVFSSKGSVEVYDPPAQDRPFLRDSIKNELVKAAKINANNADLLEIGSIRLIELGGVFTKQKESYHLCIYIKNLKGYKGAKEKEILQDLLQQLNSMLGFEYFDGELDSDNIVEFDITNLFDDERLKLSKELEYENGLTQTKFIPYSKFPFLVRDISLFAPIVDKQKIMESIKKEIGELCNKVYCFDEFEKDDKSSMAFRIILLSNDKTLTDEEVLPIMTKVETELVVSGYQIR